MLLQYAAISQISMDPIMASLSRTYGPARYPQLSSNPKMKRSTSPAASSCAIWSPIHLNPVSTLLSSTPQCSATASARGVETIDFTATGFFGIVPFSIRPAAIQSRRRTPTSLPLTSSQEPSGHFMAIPTRSASGSVASIRSAPVSLASFSPCSRAAKISGFGQLHVVKQPFGYSCSGTIVTSVIPISFRIWVTGTSPEPFSGL